MLHRTAHDYLLLSRDNGFLVLGASEPGPPRWRTTAENPGAWPGSIFHALSVNQIVGAPATPAFCMALFNSALFAKACAASSEANSWVTVMSLGLSADRYTA